MPGSGIDLPQANLIFTQQQLHEFIVHTAFTEFALNLRANDFGGNIPSIQHQVAARADRLMIQEEDAANSNGDSFQLSKRGKCVHIFTSM